MWGADGAGPPARLREALARREIRVISVGDSFGAMAEVVRLARHEDVSALILLLVEPAGLGRKGQVVRSLGAYVPEATCWMYDPAGTPELREVAASEAAAWLEEEGVRGAVDGGGDGPNGGGGEATGGDGPVAGPGAGGGGGADAGPTLKLVDPEADEPEAAVKQKTGGLEADKSVGSGAAMGSDAAEADGPEIVVSDAEYGMLMGREREGGGVGGPS